MEKIQLVVVLLPLLLIQLILKYPSSITLLVTTAGLVIVTIAALAYFHFKYMRNWQRFTRREQADR